MEYCLVENEGIYYERHGTPGAPTLLFVHGARICRNLAAFSRASSAV
ncbi:hypothetical protein [Effusibacillus lacus]|nr:hypothetical protein [Effusibacillus lacus]TCS75353.1 hypothetical protein EDD64_108105 [Effusibacillus lacus]